MLTKNLFIFPDAVNRQNDNENIKLNVKGAELLFYHNGVLNIINTELLREGSSTVVLNNGLTNNTYVLYNFREILEVLDMAPSEFLNNLSQRCFMQIDKSGGKLFIKVFLLKGVNELLSDTDDFSSYSHCTVDCIHELDWRYSWTVKNVQGKLDNNILTLSFDLAVSDFWKPPIFISHGGQTIKVMDGTNVVSFQYVQTEKVYLGPPNCRYKARAIDVARLLGGV